MKLTVSLLQVQGLAQKVTDEMIAQLPGTPFRDRPGGDRTIGSVERAWLDGETIMAEIMVEPQFDGLVQDLEGMRISLHQERVLDRLAPDAPSRQET